MDPLSIATAACTAAQICFSILKSYSRFAEAARNVDDTIEGLDSEIRNLGDVLGQVQATFEAKPQQMKHWKYTLGLVERCDWTLKQLKMILEKLGSRPHHSVGRNPLKQYKLNKKQPTISILRSHISSYIQMLQISLQTISLYVKLLTILQVNPLTYSFIQSRARANQ